MEGEGMNDNEELYRRLQLDYENQASRLEEFLKVLDSLADIWGQPKQRKRWAIRDGEADITTATET